MDADNAGKFLKVSLTDTAAAWRLDGTHGLRAFSRSMNGLNHVCGICREIIR